MSIAHSDSEAGLFIFSLKRQKFILKKYLTFVISVRPHIYSPLVSLKAFNSKFDLNMFSKLSHFGGFKRGRFPLLFPLYAAQSVHHTVCQAIAPGEQKVFN